MAAIHGNGIPALGSAIVYNFAGKHASKSHKNIALLRQIVYSYMKQVLCCVMEV